MLSKAPIILEKISGQALDKEILRIAMIAELDAISLYEQLATQTPSPEIKAVLMDVAKEEKTHAGEFQALLLNADPEQVAELEHGRNEVKELTGK
jgi:rubrerythrin